MLIEGDKNKNYENRHHYCIDENTFKLSFFDLLLATL